MKTQILMNENNVDWLAILTDGEERTIFDILRQNKIQLESLTMLDNATNRITFTDYLASDIKELTVKAVIEINGDVEKRTYEFLKKSSGWSVIAEFKGVKQPINLSINESQTAVDNHVVIDITGTGSGDSASISLYAQTKLAS